MATKMKTAEKRKKSSPRAAGSKNPKKKAPTKAAKRRAAPKKPKQAAKKLATLKKTRTAKTPAIPRPKTFAEKLRDANSRIDVHGDDMENEAVRTGEDERDGDDAEEFEGEADGTSEQE